MSQFSLLASPTRAQQNLLLAERAIGAWASLMPQRAQLPRVESIILKRKAVAFRLCEAARDGTDVIGKICGRDTAAVEEVVYRQILPAAGLDTLRCYSRVDDDAEDFCWLFVEDAGGAQYDPAIHSALAARWLGRMHQSAGGPAKAANLPRRNVDFFLAHLAAAKQRIAECDSNSRLTAADCEILAGVVRLCDQALHLRDKCEAICNASASTLVHGDFVEKNLRVRGQNDTAQLMVFDWEVAGFGPPAADLAQCDDLGTYAAASKISLQELQRLALVGKIFRWACAVDWQSQSLGYEWLEKPMLSMRAYRDEGAHLLAEVAKL